MEELSFAMNSLDAWYISSMHCHPLPRVRAQCSLAARHLTASEEMPDSGLIVSRPLSVGHAV
jgi:hypothetical protein